MAVTPTYPGVYISETASIPHGVVPATTNLTAIIGEFPKGSTTEAVLVSSWPEFVSLYGGLGPKSSNAAYAAYQFFLNGGIGAWIVRVAPIGAGTPATPATATIAPPNVAAATLDLTASSPGSWATNTLVATFQQSGPSAYPDADHVDLVISNSSTNTTVETVSGISAPASTSGTAAVSALQAQMAAAINATATSVTAAPSKATKGTPSATLQGGVDGAWDVPPQESAPVADAGGAPPTPDATPPKKLVTFASAVDAELEPGARLDRIAPQVFNLLCIPDLPWDAGTYATAQEFCAPRQAFILVDPPQGQTGDSMASWAESFLGPDNVAGATYFPWVQISDPVTQLPKLLPPSGTIAGVYAATDVARGVWKAPAGTTAALRGVSALESLVTDEISGQLNPAGVNCLRTFPLYGSVVWGARTLAGSDLAGSAFKYVSSRRLADFIEQSLSQSLRWAVFEPNGPALWSSVSVEVTSFMAGLFGQGAFAGGTAAAAYQVVCDASTTSTLDQLAGVVNVNVSFAPVDPAEFVMLNITIVAAAAAS